MNNNIDNFKFIYNLRSAGVTETKLLSVMESIPRSHFIGNNFKIYAFDDIALPIACGQTSTQPSIVGIMCQSLSISSRCKVLEIGTGSGYQTAILAKMARRVYSIEIIKPLGVTAKAKIDSLKIRNVTILCKDGTTGLKEQAPFDRIILGAATEDIPKVLLDQLKPRGVLVAPVGMTEKIQKIVKVEKNGTNYEYTDLKSVRFHPLTESKNGNISHAQFL